MDKQNEPCTNANGMIHSVNKCFVARAAMHLAAKQPSSPALRITLSPFLFAEPGSYLQDAIG